MSVTTYWHGTCVICGWSCKADSPARDRRCPVCSVHLRWYEFTDEIGFTTAKETR